MAIPAIAIFAVLMVLILQRNRRPYGAPPGLAETVRDLQEENETLRQESLAHEQAIGELAERLDFAERMLAQVREARALPPADPGQAEPR